MKKICFVTTVHGTLRSFALEMAEYLQQKGEYEVTFVCNPSDEIVTFLPSYVRCIPVEMERGISFSGLFAIVKLIKIFRKEKFDLVQYATPNASLYASIASKIAGVRNRLYAQWGIVYVGFFGFKRKIFKIIEKMVCMLSTHVQPISPLNQEFGIKEKLYTEKKSSVIGYGSVKGVNFQRFDISRREEYRKEIREKFDIKDKDFVFGFVARLTRDKGINETLWAFREFTKYDENVKLLICGEKDINANINEELWSWAEESKSVLVCGRVNDVNKYYAAMDVFLFPTYREGFGEVSIEAQAMGTPVITTNVPGPADSVEEMIGGIHVNSRDKEALLMAMKNIYENKNELVKSENEIVKWVKDHFDAKIILPQICEFKIKMITEGNNGKS